MPGTEVTMAERYRCPVELTVDLLGGKWRTVILAHLKEGVHRYGELRRRMPGVSEKMLTQRLRELEADGLVARQDHGTVPPHVEYCLTDEGRSLAPVLQALYDWGAERATRSGIQIDDHGSVVDVAPRTQFST
ncbi:winged helix-turn-helix transcriptional regulator [Micromonospora sp. NPDC005161]